MNNAHEDATSFMSTGEVAARLGCKETQIQSILRRNPHLRPPQQSSRWRVWAQADIYNLQRHMEQSKARKLAAAEKKESTGGAKGGPKNPKAGPKKRRGAPVTLKLANAERVEALAYVAGFVTMVKSMTDRASQGPDGIEELTLIGEDLHELTAYVQEVEDFLDLLTDEEG